MIGIMESIEKITGTGNEFQAWIERAQVAIVQRATEEQFVAANTDRIAACNAYRAAVRLNRLIGDYNDYRRMDWTRTEAIDKVLSGTIAGGLIRLMFKEQTAAAEGVR